jgi:hypothetical protein
MNQYIATLNTGSRFENVWIIADSMQVERTRFAFYVGTRIVASIPICVVSDVVEIAPMGSDSKRTVYDFQKIVPVDVETR